MAESSNNSRELAELAARLLEDHKGEDTVILDLRQVSSLTDYFVITTARSSAHMAGLLKELSRFFTEMGVRPINSHKKVSGKGWLLLDCGDFVVHVMEKEERQFYELERLWFRAERVSYSSKSS
jgi:ribosome-associated protein